MTIRTVCITAASVLALAAPATAFAREVTVDTTNHKVELSKTKAGKTSHVVYTAPFGSVPIRTPIYIYIPAMSSDATAPAAQPADCSTDMSYCSDPTELCQIWGQC